MPENYMDVTKSSLPQPVNISIGQHWTALDIFYLTSLPISAMIVITAVVNIITQL